MSALKFSTVNVMRSNLPAGSRQLRAYCPNTCAISASETNGIKLRPEMQNYKAIEKAVGGPVAQMLTNKNDLKRIDLDGLNRIYEEAKDSFNWRAGEERTVKTFKTALFGRLAEINGENFVSKYGEKHSEIEDAVINLTGLDIKGWNGFKKSIKDVRIDLGGLAFCDPKTEAILSDVDFKNTDLCGASLAGANLNGADLDGANLSEAHLDFAKFDAASFQKANLDNASLVNASLKGANLNSASLRKTKLNSAKLSDANMSYSKLNGADLQSAELYRAYLHGADLSRALMDYALCCDADLSDANLENAYLKSTYFHSANLFNANLKNAFLTFAVLHKANLMLADLRYSNIVFANVEAADFAGAKIDKINFSMELGTKGKLYSTKAAKDILTKQGAIF